MQAKIQSIIFGPLVSTLFIIKWKLFPNYGALCYSEEWSSYSLILQVNSMRRVLCNAFQLIFVVAIKFHQICRQNSSILNDPHQCLGQSLHNIFPCNIFVFSCVWDLYGCVYKNEFFFSDGGFRYNYAWKANATAACQHFNSSLGLLIKMAPGLPSAKTREYLYM